MNRKLKAIGFSVLAGLAIGAVVIAGGASAEEGGHFVSDAKEERTIIRAWETGDAPHTTRFHAIGKKIKCKKAEYTGETFDATVTEVTLTPTLENCYIEEDGFPAVTVTHNECNFILTVRAVEPDKKDNTVFIECPIGKKIELHTNACKISIGSQTIKKGGIVYETMKENEKHTITAKVTAEEIAYEKHNGVCSFLGTNGTDGILTGAMTVEGLDIDEKVVNITATGK